MASYLDVPETNAEPLSSTLKTLRLEVLQPGLYEGTNFAQMTKRVYGGQVFGQAVMAAADTLPPELSGRKIHSITAAFLRAGDYAYPITFEVEPVTDSRSFSTRRVEASQRGKTIFTCRTSFQEAQPGVDHQSPPPNAPDPETLPSSVDFFGSFEHPAAKAMNDTNSVDMRHVAGPIWVKPAQTVEKSTLIWFKMRSPLPEGSSQLLHRAMLGYATDQFMLEPIMRHHGLFWMDRGLSVATLDHAIWWHRDVNMSDWILADLASPSAQGGRGLSVARYYQHGVHVATMAQEGMVRTRRVTDS
ncbi:MAG: acyl-CoA thioesterase II [Actinomycetaceae bacterium]|nr:acyl-CoA thioesterase II [Actinomycetaceae bacterium]